MKPSRLPVTHDPKREEKTEMRKWHVICLMLLIIVGGCSSVGQMGIMTGGLADPSALLKGEQSFQELGPVEGRACRYFLLGIIPWGDSTPATAMKKALEQNGGDAIINASVETSLYGFVPIYHVFGYTCTTVKGIAIKIERP